MSIDNMQLKQEDLVGSEVVLTDVNPISNTASVDDSASGEKLNKTIARLWESINNKLSRVVNSVNGRTGVVILTSEDVGLGEVDNVSFYDIKQWVIAQFEGTFKSKKLRLFENLQGAIDLKDTNDQAVSWAPFYCDRKDDTDYRPVIGLFIWDDGTNTLNIDYKMINGIGYADDSIIYRTTAGDSIEGREDIPIGGIGVNIFKEERTEDQVLVLEHNSDKSQAGLRVDHDKLGSRVYYEETPYGKYDGSLIDPAIGGYMLWRYGSSESFKGYRVKIYIDDNPITARYINGSTTSATEVLEGDAFYIDNRWTHYSSMRNNDVIIMRFANFISTDNTIGSGVCIDFSRCQPAFGVIEKDTAELDPVDFLIKFYSLNPNTNGYGITTLQTHDDRNVKSTQLGLQLTTSSETPDMREIDVNMSGVNTLCDEESVADVKDHRQETKKNIHIFTPWGSGVDTENAGVVVTTDGTICTYPGYQILPTTTRVGLPPKWVADKFYSYDNEEYTLLTEKPDKWESTFFNYYTKNESDEYHHVKGIIPQYSYNAGGYASTIVQCCVGSLMATNFSFSDITGNQYQQRDYEVNNPRGYDKTGGLGGTESLLSVNLRKISTTVYGSDADDSVRTKLGYQFYNISGLKFVGYTNKSKLDRSKNPGTMKDIVTDLGLLDYKDAYGIDHSHDTFSGGITLGLSVNTGRFLEITPKETFRSETYYDGGKVQVRIGDGLTEQYDVLDITNMIKANAVPSRYNFTIDELKVRYMEHPEEFFVVYNNDATVYSLDVTHSQLNEKPEDWDTHWYNYEYNLGTSEHTDYVFLPYNNNTVIGFEESTENYMGPYYKRNKTYEDIDTIRNVLNNSSSATTSDPVISIVYWRRPTNRITLNIDRNVLDINEEGQLTAVNNGGGGIGGGAPGRNIRVVDTRGVYFDTMPDDIDESTGLPKYPVDEVMRLGPGLKIVGSGTKTPAHMKLWGYINTSKRSTYLSVVLDTWNNMPFGEMAVYFKKYMYKMNLSHGNTYDYWGFVGIGEAVLAQLKVLPVRYSGISYELEDADNDFALCDIECQSLLSDPTDTVSYSDARYNIKTYTYLRSDIRTYLSLRPADVREGIWDILRGVRALGDGTNMDNKPSDQDKLKIMQYFADHYNLGTVTSLESIDPRINDTLIVYDAGSSSDPYPLDWAFSFFTQAILIGGEWRKIAEGAFTYTSVGNRPYNWSSTFSTYYMRDPEEIEEIYIPIPTQGMPTYKPNAYYTLAGTVFTVVTDATEPESWALVNIGNYYYRELFTPVDTEPVGWGTIYTNYFYTDYDTDPSNPKVFKRIAASTAPTFVANKFYVEDTSGSVEGYVQLDATPAFTASEYGNAENMLMCAPVFENDKYCEKISDNEYQLLASQPVDWYTNFTSYYERLGEEGAYTYDPITGEAILIHPYHGTTYSRSAQPTS